MCFLCGTNLLNPKYGIHVDDLGAGNSSFSAESATTETDVAAANPDLKVIDQDVTNPYLAALLLDIDVPKPVGWDTSTTLKYYFDDTNARAWSDAEKQAMANAFSSWSTFANIDFEVTTDRTQADFINVLIESTTALGYVSALPYEGTTPISINLSVSGTAFDTLDYGGDSYLTAVHEIGHAIGLSHPHNGKLFPGVTEGQDQETGDNGQNQQIYTVMSYAVGWTGEPVTTEAYGTAATPMAFDIAAAQILYGKRDANTGDNTYNIDTSNDVGSGWFAIWDTGGTDTISASGANDVVTIDLREAPLTGANAGGYVSWMAGITGGYTIANGVTLENAIGGNAADKLTGNNANNEITGGNANDTIDGGDGTDTAKYAGEATNFTIQIVKNGATTVQDRNGSEGTDSLTNIEQIDFTGTKDVDLSILAGVANVSSADLSTFIEMYIAYFNRAPDAEGLFYWGTRLSEGMSIQDIAASFFVQAETVALYGGKSNSELVDAVYQNFLGRAPDTEGKAYWVSELDNGIVQRGEFLLAIINGAKAATGSATDQAYIEAKADIGTYYSVIKGMSDVDNAKAAMAAFDGSDASKTSAKNTIDGYYSTASAASNGELLIQLTGVMDDPFAIG